MANLIEVKLLAELDTIQSIREYTQAYGPKGNVVRPLFKNDADQVLVQFSIATPDAAVWLYRWIHKYKFNGDVDKSRDAELEWVTGSTSFRDLIYDILYKGKYDPVGKLEDIKMPE